jgi:hypothetical protein
LILERRPERDRLPADASYEGREVADLVALARLGRMDGFGDEREPGRPAPWGRARDRGRHRRRVLRGGRYARRRAPGGRLVPRSPAQAGEQSSPLTVDALMQLHRAGAHGCPPTRALGARLAASLTAVALVW